MACNTIDCINAQNWRPVFKISNNVPYYGGENNTYWYWKQGISTFDNITSDTNFTNSNNFDLLYASTIDNDTNYRSLIIDKWTEYYNNNAFNKVKVSLYTNNSESVYFTYNATNNSVSWFNQNNLIDSSYNDLSGFNQTTQSGIIYWNIQSMIFYA